MLIDSNDVDRQIEHVTKYPPIIVLSSLFPKRECPARSEKFYFKNFDQKRFVKQKTSCLSADQMKGVIQPREKPRHCPKEHNKEIE